MGVSCMIASGKGGVGKTTVTAALGHALCRKEKCVCIIDTDIGLRDQDAALGLRDQIVFDLLDVCGGGCELDRALVAVPDEPRLKLLAAAQFAEAGDLDPKRLREVIQALCKEFDWVLIDCPAGIGTGLRSVLAAEPDEAIIVATPDDVCIRDAERAADIIIRETKAVPRLIVNKIMPELVRNGEMFNARTVAQTLEIELIGEIPWEESVTRAQLRGVQITDVDCETTFAVRRIAGRLCGEKHDFPEYGAAKKRRFGIASRLFGKKELKMLDR